MSLGPLTRAAFVGFPFLRVARLMHHLRRLGMRRHPGVTGAEHRARKAAWTLASTLAVVLFSAGCFLLVFEGMGDPPWASDGGLWGEHVRAMPFHEALYAVATTALLTGLGDVAPATAFGRAVGDSFGTPRCQMPAQLWSAALFNFHDEKWIETITNRRGIAKENNQNPNARRDARTQTRGPRARFVHFGLLPPLTCEDGAARVLDPVLSVVGEDGAEPKFGRNYHNFSEKPW